MLKTSSTRSFYLHYLQEFGSILASHKQHSTVYTKTIITEKWKSLKKISFWKGGTIREKRIILRVNEFY